MNKLAMLRKVAGLTQNELARKGDVSRITIARIESGATGMTAGTAAKLACALGCTIDELLGEKKGADAHG